MNKPNFDKMTLDQIREWSDDAAYRVSQLGEIKATLVVNCRRGYLPCEYNDTHTVLWNLIAILVAMTKEGRLNE